MENHHANRSYLPSGLTLRSGGVRAHRRRRSQRQPRRFLGRLLCKPDIAGVVRTSSNVGDLQAACSQYFRLTTGSTELPGKRCLKLLLANVWCYRSCRRTCSPSLLLTPARLMRASAAAGRHDPTTRRCRRLVVLPSTEPQQPRSRGWQAFRLNPAVSGHISSGRRSHARMPDRYGQGRQVVRSAIRSESRLRSASGALRSRWPRHERWPCCRGFEF